MQGIKETLQPLQLPHAEAWFDNVAAKKADQNARLTPQPDLSALIAALCDIDCFKNLHNTKTAKQTIRKCISDWSNFRKALAAYKKNPSSFVKRPKPPFYKESLAQVIFYNETIKDGQMNRKLDRLTVNVLKVSR